MKIQVWPDGPAHPPALVERDQLEVTHHMRWGEGTFEQINEYRLDGKLVRDDHWVVMLRGADMTAAPGSVGG